MNTVYAMIYIVALLRSWSQGCSWWSHRLDVVRLLRRRVRLPSKERGAPVRGFYRDPLFIELPRRGLLGNSGHRAGKRAGAA